MSESKKVTKKRIRRSLLIRILNFLSWMFMLFLVGSCFYFLWEMSEIHIFSSLQLLVCAAVSSLLTLFLSILLVVIDRPCKAKYISMVLSLVIAMPLTLGGYYLNQTNIFLNMLGDSSSETTTSQEAEQTGDQDEEKEDSTQDLLAGANNLSNRLAMTVTTYTMKGSGITKPDQLTDVEVGTIASMDEAGTQAAIIQLEQAGASFETIEYPSEYALVDALYNDQVSAIILPEQYHGNLLNAANDINKYNALTTFTNIVDQYIYSVELPANMKNPADPVADITKDPFIVLISGNDNYGTLDGTSRSDVNMLAVVNPVTYQVLLVSLPRDTYAPITCSKNQSACAAVAGQPDKLTHSGIYGVGSTETTIENLLGIEINYTVQLNFSSLINVVDALGGIDVYVDEGLAVETFYSNGTEGVSEGWNHLDGERALGYARERHAYVNGDMQRIKNQQAVFSGIVDKLTSPALLMNYPAFLRALSTATTTNVPTSQIRQFLQLEISQFPHWNIQSYAVFGQPQSLYSPSLNAYASMTVVSQDSLDAARQIIEAVMKGDIIDVNVQEQTSEDENQQT